MELDRKSIYGKSTQSSMRSFEINIDVFEWFSEGWFELHKGTSREISFWGFYDYEL